MSTEPRHERAPAFDLATKVAWLRRPETYPERPRQVLAVETHMSFVFLTERHAYKLKKPVRYEYLDFSTLAARARNCREELRLNQRLAAGVYLDVVPLVVATDGRVYLEAEGEVVEWLVKMRRLPANRMLDAVLREGTLDAADLDRLAGRLAAFYRRCAPEAMRGEDYFARLAETAATNRRVLAQTEYGLDAQLVAAVHDAEQRFLDSARGLLEQRARSGRLIEGHGDLRPEHVCLEDEPVVIDCLEFNREFRIADAADELAFLAMECDRLGAPEVGERVFRAYTAATGDDPPAALIAFYKAVRACLRARLAILHVNELPREAWGKWRALATDYLERAQGYCRVF
jgi:aminoglycoside phosphotransferase family enzyme